MKRVGLVGWRGMVGSVLMQRMLEEQDFDLIEPVFFTTSNVGGQGPSVGKDIAPLKDAYNIEELKTLDVILTCQGGDYTNEVFPKLREAGWQGYWIDADFVTPEDMLAELREDNIQLAAYMRETHDMCSELGDVATTSLLENWIDEAERRVWFLFESSRTK